MKLLSRLIIASVICLVAIPMTITPTQADSGILISPESGHVGGQVTIYGSFISHWGETVYIYYEVADDDWQHVDTAEISSDIGPSPSERTLVGASFDVPESNSGEHNIRVCYDTDPDKTIGNAYAYFTVEPRIKITNPRTATGSVGTKVDVEGTGFGADEKDINLLFAGDIVSTDFTADRHGTWEGSFHVPAASEGKHYTSAEGRDTDEDDVTKATFMVEPGISLSSEQGYVGDTVIVRGSGFADREAGIKVTYDGTDQGSSTTAGINGAWETSFQVPPSAKGIHKIDAYGSSTKAKDIEDKYFEVAPSLMLSPNSGHVDTVITVVGSGFPATISIVITYDGDQKGNVITDTKGTFSNISFEATHTQSIHTQNHPVGAIYDSTTVSATFTMESAPPPPPTLVSPANESRVGLAGKGTPIFEWDTVTDDSEISHYQLMVANDEEFSDVLIDQRLTPKAHTNTMTFTVKEALPYDTYYWQVRAVDRAQNIGDWSATYSFRAGLMVLGAFIAIIVVVVIAIGALIYIFVLRKRVLYRAK